MWQVPGLTIAAQAFLIALGFSAHVSDTSRRSMGAFALVLALAAIQLLLKHRLHEETYSEVIDIARKAQGLDRWRLKGDDGFRRLAMEYGSDDYVDRWSRGWRTWFTRHSSVLVWTIALFAVAAIDLLVALGFLA